MPNIDVNTVYRTNRFMDEILRAAPNLTWAKAIKNQKPSVAGVLTVFKVTPINRKQALLQTRGKTDVAIVPLSLDLLNALNVNKKAYVYAVITKTDITIKGLAPIQDW